MKSDYEQGYDVAAAKYAAEIAALRARLDVACHVSAGDKVGFDYAVLDKIAGLERALQAANADAAALFIVAAGSYRCCKPHAWWLNFQEGEDTHAADCPITLHRARVGGEK